MNMPEFEPPVGIAEFQLESNSITRHCIATDGAAGPGSRPAPRAHLMLSWKLAGANRGSGFLT
jgi:hypothetical protein